MKINDIQGLEIEQLTSRQAEKVPRAQGQPDATQTTAERDVIQISPRSRLLQKASQVVYQTPEVRPEKVAALKDAIEQGTYQVETRKVANKLLVELLQEK